VDTGLKLSMDEIPYIAKTSLQLDEKKAAQCMRIVELLEDHDDSQNVYGNYDIPDDIMEKISGEK
jgi:transcriptional/translational regulatory protein YebC/TACO1